MSDEEDYPEIGDRRHGRTLVCVGDDKPDQWVDWLESLVSEYEELERIAEEHTVNLDTGSKRERIEGWQDYCEAMGISIDGEAWESSMISGHYVMGWAELGTIRSARKTGKEILKRLRRNLLEQIRSVRIKELQKIKDLDTLIERTRDDRKTLLNENDRLKADLESSQNRTEALQQALAESKLKDTSALISDCLRIACAVNKSERQIIRAGPLVLWSDGVVYAFTSRGRQPLPTKSPHLMLINVLQRAGHTVVKVGEMTVIGGWLSGPHYRKGTNHISGWMSVWEDSEKQGRKFIADAPAKLTVVNEIHEYFKASSQATEMNKIQSQKNRK